MSTSLRVLLIALASFIGVLAVFGIALGVAEWRMPDDNSDLIANLDAEIAELEDEIAAVNRANNMLESRVSTVETPLPIADRDIQELYARTNYQTCTFDANIALSQYEDKVDATYAAYLADNATFAEYTADFDAYNRAFDRYNAELDTCWETYLGESPFE